MISAEFEKVQNIFFGKHCEIFEEGEENKIEYMNIFKLYQSEIEKYI